MAHFRGTVEGNRAEASRLGSKGSGLITTCNGWNIGARAFISHNETLGRDEVSVYITNGSGYRSADRYLGTFYRKGNKFIKIR